MRKARLTPPLGALALVLLAGVPGRVAAQEDRQAPPSNAQHTALDALNAKYEKQLRDLECRRIADLAALAEKSAPSEADAAYRQLFGLAIACGLCSEARPAAERCLSSPSSEVGARSLAVLVRVFSHADKGEHGRALDDWKALFRPAPGGDRPAARLDEDHALAVGEAYLQRLIREGRYDAAHQLCELACSDNAPASLKDHFEDRMARLELVGKPAPPIAGEDVDGHHVSLADLKGKVVLVDFWATWCPPCIDAIPALNAILRKYGDQGLVILGVNVDALHENVRETKTALPTVRRFMVKHRVTWTNLQSGQPTGDLSDAYRVEQIPANFLIGRNGKVIAVEQSGDALERAVKMALDQGH
jgi:thiol-disulfide isomerase/thioredoxin